MTSTKEFAMQRQLKCPGRGYGGTGPDLVSPGSIFEIAAAKVDSLQQQLFNSIRNKTFFNRLLTAYNEMTNDEGME